MFRTKRIQTSTNSAGATPSESGSGSARTVVHAATGAAIGPRRFGYPALLQWPGRRVAPIYFLRTLPGQYPLLRAHCDDRVDSRGTQRGNPARHDPDRGHGQRRRDQCDGIVRGYPEQHAANNPTGEEGTRDA